MYPYVYTFFCVCLFFSSLSLTHSLLFRSIALKLLLFWLWGKFCGEHDCWFEFGYRSNEANNGDDDGGGKIIFNSIHTVEKDIRNHGWSGLGHRLAYTRSLYRYMHTHINLNSFLELMKMDDLKLTQYKFIFTLRQTLLHPVFGHAFRAWSVKSIFHTCKIVHDWTLNSIRTLLFLFSSFSSLFFINWNMNREEKKYSPLLVMLSLPQFASSPLSPTRESLADRARAACTPFTERMNTNEHSSTWKSLFWNFIQCRRVYNRLTHLAQW